MPANNWLTSTDPQSMIFHLMHWWPGEYTSQTETRRCPVATDRKFLLFCQACCDLILNKPGDKKVEKYYNDTGEDIVEMARHCAHRRRDTTSSSPISRCPVENIDKVRADLLRDIFGDPWNPVVLHDRPILDSFGRPINTISPSVLDWNDRTIPGIASLIYHRKAFEDMPVLADALEEAGAIGIVVEHCRNPATHVQGCWVLDLLLGKE